MNRTRAVLDAYRVMQGRTFAWGEADCLTLAADAALRITGSDPAAGLRGKYNSSPSALRLMASRGWENMRAVAASMYPEQPVAQARTGDWAAVADGQGKDALGVVWGEHILVWREDGMARVPLLQALTSYRVGA
jgi:hypothetical protein